MSIYYLYKTFCVNENVFKYKIETNIDKTCPIDNLHETMDIINIKKIPTYIISEPVINNITNILNICDSTNNNIDIYLPNIFKCNVGTLFIFKKISDQNIITINSYSSQLIQNSIYYQLNNINDTLVIVNNGNIWEITELSDIMLNKIKDNLNSISLNPREILIGTEVGNKIIKGSDNDILFIDPIENIKWGKYNHDNIENNGVYNHSEIDLHLESINNPHSVNKHQIGLSNVENIRNNTNSLVDPLQTDDLNSGYSIGSKWINTNTNNIFICTDNIASSSTWVNISNKGSVVSSGTTNKICIFGDNINEITDSNIEINNGKIISNINNNEWCMHLNNSSTQSKGLFISSGDTIGDISLKINNYNNTKNILELETNTGSLVLGDTYNNVKTYNNNVYGIDNQNNNIDSKDINTKFGLYRINGRPCLYNTEHQYAISNQENTTASEIWVNRLNLITNNLPNGVYKINYTFDVKSSKAGKLISIAFEINNEQTIYNFFNDNYINFNNFTIKNLSGINNLNILYKVDKYNEVFLRNVIIEVYRLN